MSAEIERLNNVIEEQRIAHEAEQERFRRHSQKTAARLSRMEAFMKSQFLTAYNDEADDDEDNLV